MASWVVVADTSLVKYADKKFVEVQTEWKPLVTIAAVPLYRVSWEECARLRENVP